MIHQPAVLVVDDNVELCESLKDILEIKGFTVATAYDGSEAVESMKTCKPDMVLMDIIMPRMNGVQSFDEMRKIDPQVPVILMSAYSVEDLVTGALRNGAFGYLKKPLDFDKLFEVMDKAGTNGKLIMVVDDDEVFCLDLKETLTKRGYRVCVAGDGIIAIEKSRETKFDVIILDMRLSTLNGLHTYQAIHDIRINIPLIVITGYGKDMAASVQEILNGGASEYMEKPVNMDKLLRVIEQVIEKSERK